MPNMVKVWDCRKDKQSRRASHKTQTSLGLSGPAIYWPSVFETITVYFKGIQKSRISFGEFDTEKIIKFGVLTLRCIVVTALTPNFLLNALVSMAILPFGHSLLPPSIEYNSVASHWNCKYISSVSKMAGSWLKNLNILSEILFQVSLT